MSVKGTLDFKELAAALPEGSKNDKLEFYSRLENAMLLVDLDGSRNLDFYEFLYISSPLHRFVDTNTFTHLSSLYHPWMQQRHSCVCCFSHRMYFLLFALLACGFDWVDSQVSRLSHVDGRSLH